MDGDEILLEYKPLAKKLGLNVRTISRGIDCLVRLKALRRSRQDRVVNGRMTRNVVGVVPDLVVIAKLSGVALDDILSARSKAPAPSRRDNRIPPPTASPAPDHGRTTRKKSTLTAIHIHPSPGPDTAASVPAAFNRTQTESRIERPIPPNVNSASSGAHPEQIENFHRMVKEAFKEAFLDVVRGHYTTRWAQDNSDRMALMTLPVLMGNDVEAQYREVAARYLKMLAKQTGIATYYSFLSAAFGEDQMAQSPFTLEVFLRWAQKRGLLPTKNK
jgi:hypothetical protein